MYWLLNKSNIPFCEALPFVPSISASADNFKLVSTILLKVLVKYENYEFISNSFIYLNHSYLFLRLI